MSAGPLAFACPACLAEPDEGCYSTSSDEPRRAPHRLRALATARELRRCETCEGVGWQPAVTNVRRLESVSPVGLVARGWNWLRSRTWV